jgi:Pyridoxamine 5'-phosphate oxidase
MPSTDTLLAHATHCLLAHRSPDGPVMTPLACWSDGGGLWLMTSRRAVHVESLRRDPRCAVWIEPLPGADSGVAIDGSVRIYDLADPLRLALHTPTISAALAAFALTHRSTLAGFVRDLPQASRARTPERLVLMRVRIDRARSSVVPQHVTGVGPVLPTQIPSAVRRTLTGVRHVALALERGEVLMVQPAVWGAGFQLDVGAGLVPPAATPACVAVDRHVDGRPAARAGLLLEGTVDSGFRFRPARATWWEGWSVGSATLTEPATASGIVLPD